jgi:hypothetical protein
MLHCIASSVFGGMKLSIFLIFVPFISGINPRGSQGFIPENFHDATRPEGTADGVSRSDRIRNRDRLIKPEADLTNNN